MKVYYDDLEFEPDEPWPADRPPRCEEHYREEEGAVILPVTVEPYGGCRRGCCTYYECSVCGAKFSIEIGE